MSTRQLHLNVNVNSSGRHPASWQVADDPLGFLDLAFYETIGRLAERGRLDAVFLSDEFDYGWPEIPRPWQSLDPFIPLTAVSRVTEHVGLIATISSTFQHPYNIARIVASLDLVSGGRAAWNVVGTRADASAPLFGLDHLPDHDDRYARAEEAIEVVHALWGSWSAPPSSPTRRPGSSPTRPGCTPSPTTVGSSRSPERSTCLGRPRGVPCSSRQAAPRRASRWRPGTPTRCSACTTPSTPPGSSTTT